MPECRVELLIDDSDHDPVVIIGDIAHVEASSDAGPRGNRGRGIRNRDEYENLILLCRNCHAKIDGQKKKFAFDEVIKIKSDHEAWVRASLPERGQSNSGWVVIILQGSQPIDVQQALDSFSPEYSEGEPYVIEISQQREDWRKLYERIALCVQTIFDRSDPFNKRFNVFPLAPVSACVVLGFCLTDRPRVRLFQYHRHAQSWKWEDPQKYETKVNVVGLPNRVNRKHGEVVICFNLSAQIQKDHINAISQNAIGTISLQIPHPSTSWLRSIDQLNDLGKITRETFESIQNHFPNATCWHLLLATPAPAAVRIGQAINPSMTPPFQLYEFDRRTTPMYIPSIRLGDSNL